MRLLTDGEVCTSLATVTREQKRNPSKGIGSTPNYFDQSPERYGNVSFETRKPEPAIRAMHVMTANAPVGRENGLMEI
jgi:hypothetical protein